MTWFPLVGAVLGLGTGFGYQLLKRWFNEPVSAALTIFIYIILTRGLHMDGFMDTVDGFFSRKERDKILEIMKEPAVGSFAVLAAGVWFLLLFSAIPMLTLADHVMLHSFTRFGVLLPALFLSYPRESGTGKFFVEHVTLSTVFSAVVILLVTGAAVYAIDIPSRVRLPVYGGCLVLSLVIAAVSGLWAKKKIGGITGDVLGFIIETAFPVMVLFILLANNFI